MDKILRINVSSSDGPTAVYEPLGKYAGLGGRAMAAKVVSEEVSVCCHPLGPDNKLVLAPGMLCGSPAVTTDRLSVGCKSPLTGMIKIANSAAEAAGCMARLGIAAIILEGKPANNDLYKIYINKNEVRIAAQNSLRMLTNYDLIDQLKPEYGDKVAVISIGTAGEMRMASSTIAFTDTELRPTRHAGRGGVGAVMGSKGIKAIILNSQGTSPRKPANPDLFQKAHTVFLQGLRKHPVTGEKRLTYGTNALNAVPGKTSVSPSSQFKDSIFSGQTELSDHTLPKQEQLSGNQGSYVHNCQCGSPIECSCLYPDMDNRQPASEAIWSHGGRYGFFDADSAGSLAFLVDTYGFDSIEMGMSLGLAIEAGIIEFGDTEGAIRLVHEAGKGTPLGRIIGAGAASVAKAYGIKEMPVISDQAFPLYDTRMVKEIDFQRAAIIQRMERCISEFLAGLFQDGTLLGPIKPEMRTELPKSLIVATAAMDTLGCCLFVSFAILDQPDTFQALVNMINGLYDHKLTTEAVMELGDMVLKMEHDFDAKSGFGINHDRLPRYVACELLAPNSLNIDALDKEQQKVLHV